MRLTRSKWQAPCLGRGICALIFLLASAVTAPAACTITSGDATGYVGIPFVYQITATGGPRSYSASGLPPGLSVDAITGLISGISTVSGTYPVTLGVICGSGSDSKVVTFTITRPPIPNNAFVGFRLPDFLTLPGLLNTPRLMLQMGANGGTTTSNRFNATLEVDASGGLGTAWVPYNHFVGINDINSWITDAPLPVRDALTIAGLPRDFSTAQLTQSPPGVYMKADPRATRFGIFQMDTNPTTNSRIVSSLWPGNSGTVPNGYGGTIGTTFLAPVEHAPNRFSGAGAVYYPATFCINNGVTANPTPPSRYAQANTYADNDGITRLADAVYADPTLTSTGSSTPYNATSYGPIILNRPFRNVGELGYAFRDLPWKTVDFFSDKSADAGLLDIFTVNDGAQVLDGNGNIVGMAPPTMAAGCVNLNTTQLADVQSVLAGSIVDETSSTTVNPTGTGAMDAPVLASNIVSATSTTPMQNKAELITRSNLPTTILPLPTTSQPKQIVKAQREVVARAVSSVAQTRVWNLLIDVVAQSGHFKPNANSLQNDFVVEGEQHYWVHVAIDRFTGRVIDKQIETVNE